jgi:DDE superfamily endonuclease
MQLGFRYRNNAKAWMTAALYDEWIHEWDRDLQMKNRKILLFQDNFSGHIIPDDLQSIEVKNFEPNLTAHVQPMDQGIIQCFKAHYRAKYIHRAVDCYEAGITPSKVYEINQLEAMRLADAAWHEVDTTTIRNCWRKAGILPGPNSAAIFALSPPLPCPSIPISSLINLQNTTPEIGIQVEAALDRLELTGILQSSNRMSLAALLNPPEESSTIDNATDVEIFQAVMDAKEDSVSKHRDGGHDDDEDIHDNTPRRPTRNEALQAARVIQHYVQEVNDPFARKLEAMVSSFGHQMRLLESQSLAPTQITDYFPRN